MNHFDNDTVAFSLRGVFSGAHDLCKGIGHKYIKRVQYVDSKGKKKYRYWYTIPKGVTHLVEREDLVPGSRFRHGGDDSHYQVIAVGKGKIRVKKIRDGKHREPVSIEDYDIDDFLKKIHRYNGMKYSKKKHSLAEHFADGDDIDSAPKELTAKEKKAKKKKKGENSRRKHVEVGEHVGGSRKDRAVRWLRASSDLDGLSPSDAQDACMKNKILPDDEETAKYIKKMGGTAEMYQLRLAVRGMIAPKAHDSDEGRRRYVDGINYIEKVMDGCHTLADAEEAFDELFMTLTGQYVDHEKFNSRHDAYKRGLELAKEFREKYPAVIVHRYRRGAGNVIQNKDGTWSAEGYSGGAYRDSLAKMLDAIGLEKKIVPKSTVRELFEVRKKKPTTLFRKLSEASELAKKVGFGAQESKRKKAPKENKPVSLSEIMKMRSKEEIIQKKGGRIVKEANAKQFMDDFNLTNVQFGQWANDAEREHHLKNAHEAFFDLADVLGVDPKVISMGGELAIAFGARGTGKFSAHYEPSNKIINMTKLRGGGSLAHEWSHFLDHLLGSAHKTRDDLGEHVFASDLDKKSDLPPKLKEAYEGLIKAMKISDETPRESYMWKFERKLHLAKIDDAETPSADSRLRLLTAESNHRKMDRFFSHLEKHGPASAVRAFGRSMSEYTTAPTKFYAFARGQSNPGYWASNVELFARGFEAYIEDKLSERKQANTYLVSGTQIDWADLVGNSYAQPYPRKKERKSINAAFDKLFEAIKEGDHFKKAFDLYARWQSDTLGVSAPGTQRRFVVIGI